MSNKSFKYYLFSFLILLMGLSLRLFMLDSQSLWNDESATLSNTNGLNFWENSSIILNLPHADRFQPLYFMGLFFWRQTFGNTEFALRAFSVLLGMGTIIITYLIAKRIYDVKHAFWTTLLISTSSFAVYYSQDARPPILLLFISAVQLYSYTYFLNPAQDKKQFRYLFAVTTGIATFSSVGSVPFTIALCICHFVFERKKKQWLMWWIPAFFFSLPAIYIHLTAPNALTPDNILVTRATFPLIQNIAFTIYGLLIGLTYGPPVELLKEESKSQLLIEYLPSLLVLLVVVSLITYLVINTLRKEYNTKNTYQRADYLFALLLTVSIILASLYAIGTQINLLPRHCPYLLLPIVLLLPSCLRPVISEKTSHKFTSKLAYFSVSSLIVLNLYSLFNHYFNQKYWKDDYRSTAQYLLAKQDSSTKTILLVGKPNLIRYYGDDKTLYSEKLLEDLNTDNFADKVNRLTQNSERVFIVVSRKFNVATEEVLNRKMSNLYVLKKVDNFSYIKVYSFIKKNDDL